MVPGRHHGSFVSRGLRQLVLKEVLSSSLGTGLCFVLGCEFSKHKPKGLVFSPYPNACHQRDLQALPSIESYDVHMFPP